jgi:hypothetical protein
VGIGSTADAFHSVYQQLSGDGSIVARVVSWQVSSTQAGVMIRETLNTGATNGYTYYLPSSGQPKFSYRASTGGSTSTATGFSASLPYWVKLVRSGNTFSGYGSPDGVNWTQIGTSQTITMAQNVYVGLAVSSQTSTLGTATFDNVSVSSTTSPAPVITGLSATTGLAGSQVVISGTGFGATQNGSVVTLSTLPVRINSWSATAITITIPAGATSGPLLVSVAPSMNDSNAVTFAVTSQPLPTAWLDQDIGSVGLVGSATFVNDVFTVKGAGAGVSSTSDAFHSVYQLLSGDGSIVARVVSWQVNTSQEGVMIRETLSPGATNGFMYFFPAYGYSEFSYRTSTGGATSSSVTGSMTVPLWVKLVRSGNSFSAFRSPDGVNWTQQGTSQTITMAQSVYVGLAVSSGSTSTLATATFDNVSISTTATPAPVITSVSGTTGSIGSQVLITGSGFGSIQNGSVVRLNDAPVTINSWSATSILMTIPTGATSGQLLVSVAPSMNDSNAVMFTVTTQPLPTLWLDGDIGQVGVVGSATYVNGTFTINGAGLGVNYNYTTDALHFVYQPLSGDGTIVARIVSIPMTCPLAPRTGSYDTEIS